MTTPDTEWEKAELAVFWDEIAQHLPKCMERNALGDEKIFHAFATAYPKMKKHLLSSRDTYWKERVRKEVEDYFDIRLEDLVNEHLLNEDPHTETRIFEAKKNRDEILTITNEDNLK